MMTKLATAGLTLSLLAIVQARPGSTQTFRMADSLASMLSELADSATVEQARCLYGRTSPNFVMADSALEPDVRRRSGVIISMRPCPFGAVALWHVHVLAHTMASSADAACFLSPGDVGAGMRSDAPLVMVVQVTRRVWCWWSRNDVEDARTIGLQVSPPPLGQLHHDVVHARDRP